MKNLTPSPLVVLQAATPPQWLDVCQSHLPELLSDHAHCERKAAASALSLISRAPSDTTLVTAMAALAREEAGHLQRVHREMVQRGWPLQSDRKDDYVLALRAHIRKGRTSQLMEELLVACLIEARSAERLGLLAEGLQDEGLRRLYRDLAGCEAGHATLFFERAQAASPDEAEDSLQEWLRHEAEVVRGLPVTPRIHG
ncbi:MAG: tRNA-(ms[2]io[6]A)-hydroxylase [Myxococcota bacterium]